MKVQILPKTRIGLWAGFSQQALFATSISIMMNVENKIIFIKKLSKSVFSGTVFLLPLGHVKSNGIRSILCSAFTKLINIFFESWVGDLSFSDTTKNF